MVIQDYAETLSPNLYFDRHFNMEAGKILPGEYYVTRRDMLLVTVLGSCVSACIRDVVSGIGGMNHFMLPDGGSQDKDGLLSSSARYGTYAMEVLINELLKLGAKRANLEAKVFGGGRVLKGFTVGNVGQRNADFVLEFLKTENIRVVAQDLLDVYPRKVYFFPKTGKVLVKKLKSTHGDENILKDEREYNRRIIQSPISGDIDLFT